jgi:pimeloyl-ACP methyl ester carboxylesterase
MADMIVHAYAASAACTQAAPPGRGATILSIRERAATAPEAGLPFVLVHGWCCDHRAMSPVADAFPDRRHFLVDLPGHGGSADRGDAAISAQAAAVLSAVPVARFIAVGHSMGGQIALSMAASAPGRVAGAVLLDPARILPDEKVVAAGLAMQRNLARQPTADIVRAFARAQLRGPVVAAAAFDLLVETMAGTPDDLARREWDAVMAFDGPAALAALAVPTLAIVVDRSANRPADLARASRCITTGQVAAAGHMVQYEAMDQAEAMIRRWLVVAAVDAGGAGG